MLAQVFTHIAPQTPSNLVILCDHATNIVPNWINNGDLGVSIEDMNRHIAYDVGALAVSTALVKMLGAHLIHSNFSRLVIDPNRGEDDPTLIMRFYDKTIITANRNITHEDRMRRIENLHRPYHDAIRNALSSIRSQGDEPVVISIHSFTKQLRNLSPRPWHIGILYGDDARLSAPLLTEFNKIEGICVGDNQPYHGALEGDTLDMHGIRDGISHTLIEIRNDLISERDGQNKWAEICHQTLQKTFKNEGLM